MKNYPILFAILLLGACSHVPFSTLPPEAPAPEPVLPDMSSLYMVQAYETAATRITNKMIDDTHDVYETTVHPKLFVKKINKISENLPDGFYTANRAMKQVITGSDRKSTRLNSSH